jgi:hypothetical protein
VIYDESLGTQWKDELGDKIAKLAEEMEDLRKSSRLGLMLIILLDLSAY